MIYLDHNATTPVAPEVREAMLPYFTDEWGNPSSAYRFGARLKGVLETARGQVAELARKRVGEFDAKVRPLRDTLEAGILGTGGSGRESAPTHRLKVQSRLTSAATTPEESAGIPDTELNGHPIERLPNTTNITFRGVESEALLLLLDQAGICASSGRRAWRIRTSRRTWSRR